MSTNKSDEYLPSDWSWVGPLLLFMAASSAFFNTDRGPVMTAILGLTILGAAYICYVTYRAQEKREKQQNSSR